MVGKRQWGGKKKYGRTNAHQDVTPETLRTDFHVRKNARFTHDMTNIGHDVRGKRFSTHGPREQRPENISYWNKSKKAPAENRKCLSFVAGRRIELRTS